MTVDANADDLDTGRDPDPAGGGAGPWPGGLLFFKHLRHLWGAGAGGAAAGGVTRQCWWPTRPVPERAWAGSGSIRTWRRSWRRPGAGRRGAVARILWGPYRLQVPDRQPGRPLILATATATATTSDRRVAPSASSATITVMDRRFDSTILPRSMSKPDITRAREALGWGIPRYDFATIQAAKDLHRALEFTVRQRCGVLRHSASRSDGAGRGGRQRKGDTPAPLCPTAQGLPEPPGAGRPNPATDRERSGRQWRQG